MNLDRIDPRHLLQLTWQGPTLRQWLVALAVATGAFVVLLLARRLVASRLGRYAAHTPNSVDDVVAELVRRTRPYFLLAVVVAATARFLPLALSVQGAIGTALKVVSLVQIGVWGTGVIALWVRRIVDQRRALDETSSVAMLTAVGYAGRVFLWTLLLVAVLGVYDIDVTALVTGLGIGGVAIALAVQNVLGDLLAALSIVFDKPFVVGDFITVDTFAGTVEHIGLKTTRLRSVNGEQIIFSNAELLKSRIRNYKRMHERRIVLTFDVGHGTGAATLAGLPGVLREIVLAQSPVRFERSHLLAFTESSFRLETVYWVLDPDYQRHMDIQQAIHLAVLERFRAEGVDFAYPTRTVVVTGDGAEGDARRQAAAGASA
jgi:small-conductance mechanosensitive channel